MRSAAALKRAGTSRSGLIACALLACALAGCAIGPAYVAPDAPPPGLARLYVYRPFGIVGAIKRYELIHQGKRTGKITNAGYLSFAVPAGRLDLFAEGCSPSPLVLELDAGEIYYVEAVVSGYYTGDGQRLNTWDFFCKLRYRDPATGRKALHGLRRSNEEEP